MTESALEKIVLANLETDLVELARIRAYWRTSKSGKRSLVREHDDLRKEMADHGKSLVDKIKAANSLSARHSVMTEGAAKFSEIAARAHAAGHADIHAKSTEMAAKVMNARPKHHSVPSPAMKKSMDTPRPLRKFTSGDTGRGSGTDHMDAVTKKIMAGTDAKLRRAHLMAG